MDEDTRQALLVIRAAVSVLSDADLHSGQDLSMVTEMADVMLADLLAGGETQTLDHYIGRYCTLLDGPDDIAEIVIEISQQITEWETS